MKEIFGAIILLLAVITFLAVFRFVRKKGTYKDDFWGLIIDSFEFVTLIVALVLVGIILLTGK